MTVRQVHVPRWSQLMRSSTMPYLQRPHVVPVRDLSQPGVTPWFEASQPQPSGALGAFEVGADSEVRANPAFNDAWLVGATGAASRVIPQGIDYSRTPCCGAGGGAAPALSGLDLSANTLLWVGGAAVVGFVVSKLFLGKKASKAKNPFGSDPHEVARRAAIASREYPAAGRATGERGQRPYNTKAWYEYGDGAFDTGMGVAVRPVMKLKNRRRKNKSTSSYNRLKSSAEAIISRMRRGESIDAEGLDRAVYPEVDQYGTVTLGPYTAENILTRHVVNGDMVQDGKWYVRV